MTFLYEEFLELLHELRPDTQPSPMLKNSTPRIVKIKVALDRPMVV